VCTKPCVPSPELQNKIKQKPLAAGGWENELGSLSLENLNFLLMNPELRAHQHLCGSHKEMRRHKVITGKFKACRSPEWFMPQQ
jgi:hypothetical protein